MYSKVLYEKMKNVKSCFPSKWCSFFLFISWCLYCYFLVYLNFPKLLISGQQVKGRFLETTHFLDKNVLIYSVHKQKKNKTDPISHFFFLQTQYALSLPSPSFPRLKMLFSPAMDTSFTPLIHTMTAAHRGALKMENSKCGSCRLLLQKKNATRSGWQRRRETEAEFYSQHGFSEQFSALKISANCPVDVVFLWRAACSSL